jgi:hypothetical protein
MQLHCSCLSNACDIPSPTRTPHPSSLPPPPPHPHPPTPTPPRASIDAGQGPYFYLPKMESHLEARLWNNAFNLAQVCVGVIR